MIGVTATMTVKDGTQADFEAAVAELVAAVRANEPGCRLYTLCRAPDSATTYVMMELYESEAALAAHGTSEHFRTLAPRLGACLAGPPQIARMPVVV